jgi:hypothetical protein
MSVKLKKPTAEMVALLQRAGSSNYNVAIPAQAELAKAITMPLKQGVLKGDITAGIFQEIFFQPGSAVEFPLDFLAPGTEKEHIAYTIPNTGYIPQKAVEGDYVAVPTFDVGAAIDFSLKYLRDARWDVMTRAMQVLEAMFVRKKNDDCARVLMAAGVARNLNVYDDAATAGLFTKRLVALMKTVMRRNSGGNSGSMGRGVMTDLWLSPEGLEDIRSWDLTQVDDVTRRQIFLAGEAGGLTQIFNVTLHDIDELGVGQEYQLYYTNVLGGTLPTDKKEIVIGMDLLNQDSFVMPVRAELEVWEDPTLHRQRRFGMYGTKEYGVAVLDGRRVLLGSY